MPNPPPHNREFWERVNSLFHSALEHDAATRASFLEEATESDLRLRREVESLLAFHTEETRGFLEQSPAPQLLQAIGSGHDVFIPGESVDDFLILKVLGSGAFATVYLAQQESLNRRVALKVSPDIGEEGRTMAPLEHDNIVKVFSQSQLPRKHARLICMQYVAGATLEKILTALREANEKRIRTTFLDALDRLTTGDTTLNPAGMSDRERLAQLDFIDTVLWLGARLADALGYAHSRGVLHLDVKPSNILINAYGRPLVTDFNVSVNLNTEKPKVLGGTVKYMAPEHRELFDSASHEIKSSLVDFRADIYSLGVILSEMFAAGGIPMNLERPAREWESVIAKCLEPKPTDRYASADTLRRALDGCLDLRAIEKSLPPAGWVTKFTLAAPIASLASFMIGPNLLGSVVNISYNSIRIVSQLNPLQRSTFEWLVLVYNAVVYPFCTLILLRKLKRLSECVRHPERLAHCSDAELTSRRTEVLNVPLSSVVIIAAGWMPGSLFFPLALHLLVGPMPFSVFLHFFISFGISCLVAMTYVFLYSQFVSLRVFYPRLWANSAHVRARARNELAGSKARMRCFHMLAGIVPLGAAILVVLIGPDSETPSHFQTYRWLVSLLITSGMFGLLIAIRTSNLLSQTLFAFTGSEEESGRADPSLFSA